MKDERLKVLDMVEAGKIGVEDAAKLLEALKSSTPEYAEHAFRDDAAEKLNNFSKSVDTFAKDVKDKASTTFKSVEPRLKSASKTVIEKTVNVLNDISKSLNETLSNMEENAKKENACEGEETCVGNGPAPVETEAPVENAAKENE